MSMKKQRMVKLQLSGRNLKNLDMFTKSDPFLIVSRRNSNKVLTQIRRTETISNNLNPDWTVLYMSLDELCQSDFNLPIQIDVMDDDGATSEKIGSVETTLAALEAAYCNHTAVQLMKKAKARGEILVRNCTIDPPSFQDLVSSDAPGLDSADYKSSNYGFPPQNTGYSKLSSGYPPQNPGYPPQNAGYPPAQALGYSPSFTQGYPSQNTGYPPAQASGYPPSSTPGYQPNPTSGYPASSAPLYPSLSGAEVYPAGPGYPQPSNSPVYPPGPAGLQYPPNSPFVGLNGPFGGSPPPPTNPFGGVQPPANNPFV
jgi:hypothetical protein